MPASFDRRALGIRIDHQVDRMRLEHARPEYLAVNPNGVVPALRHDGALLGHLAVPGGCS